MGFGACVGKAVSKVQPRRMSAPAELLEAFDCAARDRLVDCDFLDARGHQEFLELALGGARRDINFRRQHHRRFKTNDAGSKASRRDLDFDLEVGPIAFRSEDRHEYRRIDEDQWPQSSSISSLVTSRIRSRHSRRLAGKLFQTLRERPLIVLALQFAAQRMGDRLGHVGLAQPGEFASQFADLGIANTDAHWTLRLYDDRPMYIRTVPRGQ